MEFECLKGLTISEISGAEVGSDEIVFKSKDGRVFKMYHCQECCESVLFNDVCGDIEDIINSPILLAEEVMHVGENPESITIPEYQDCFTWTFYKLSTILGSVTIKWYGESNGYYSESVDFKEEE